MCLCVLLVVCAGFAAPPLHTQQAAGRLLLAAAATSSRPQRPAARPHQQQRQQKVGCQAAAVAAAGWQQQQQQQRCFVHTQPAPAAAIHHLQLFPPQRASLFKAAAGSDPDKTSRQQAQPEVGLAAADEGEDEWDSDDDEGGEFEYADDDEGEWDEDEDWEDEEGEEEAAVSTTRQIPKNQATVDFTQVCCLAQQTYQQTVHACTWQLQACACTPFYNDRQPSARLLTSCAATCLPDICPPSARTPTPTPLPVQDDFVEVGLISRPHGVRGEVKVQLITDEPRKRLGTAGKRWVVSLQVFPSYDHRPSRAPGSRLVWADVRTGKQQQRT